ncbi:hypothetical protein GOODEAATRI_006110 [Goodea atripinnis]|uniref:Uncharacterized protein n=1 Tax=Goodea atripinnis TaxID=208336 RepID=A0ABV0NVL2_9TELE
MSETKTFPHSSYSLVSIFLQETFPPLPIIRSPKPLEEFVLMSPALFNCCQEAEDSKHLLCTTLNCRPHSVNHLQSKIFLLEEYLRLCNLCRISTHTAQHRTVACEDAWHAVIPPKGMLATLPI